jgi:TrmH family RNA methyltransferase
VRGEDRIGNAPARLSQGRAKLVRSLHRGKGRRQEGAYLAEGLRLLDELAGSPARVRFLFGTAKHWEWLAGRFPGEEIGTIGDDDDALFATEHAQGVGAVVEMPEPADPRAMAAAPGPLVYLDALADPGNVGTILRTAEWFGLRRVLFGPGSVDPYNPKVVRSSMGAIFRMELAGDVGADALRDLDRPIFALDAGGTHVLGRSPLPENAIYIVGGEAHGVSPEIMKIAELLTIRGRGEGESLNAAVAGSILFYELSRGR